MEPRKRGEDINPIHDFSSELNFDGDFGGCNNYHPQLDSRKQLIVSNSGQSVYPNHNISKIINKYSKKSMEEQPKGPSSSTMATQNKYLLHTQDITKGAESVQISLANDNGGVNELPRFFYIAKNIVYKDAHVNFSLARISDDNCCSQCFGDCLSLDLPCACAYETRGVFAYTREGLLDEKFLDECIEITWEPKRKDYYYCEKCPLERGKRRKKCEGHLCRKFIKECWSKCGCSKKCGNRIVQRGIKANIQVFKTSQGKGWGVRSLHALKKGSFVCEYAGEIVTNIELFERNQRRAGKEHTYPVLLDADWNSERILKDEEALCLDGTEFGNVARFINHRCHDSNLIEIPVEIETPDHHYYHLAFFTTRDVEPMEELTWDYGIRFDDKTHPVKAFKCKCGSPYCRDRKI